MAISLNTVNSEVVRAHNRINQLISRHSYVGDGSKERVINFNIPTSKKIAFAILSSESFSANNPYTQSTLQNSTHIHNVIINGYAISKHDTNKICCMLSDNTLKLWHQPNELLKYQGNSRVNFENAIYHLIVFYEV